MEIVRVQEKLLREDGVDLAGGVDGRLEEDVGAIRVGQEDLIRPDEEVPQALAVAVAVLDVAEHGPGRVLAGRRRTVERASRTGILLREIPDGVSGATVLDGDERDPVE